MASEDAERRGRRRWFRILGSADVGDPQGATQEESMARNDLATAEADAIAEADVITQAGQTSESESVEEAEVEVADSAEAPVEAPESAPDVEVTGEAPADEATAAPSSMPDVPDDYGAGPEPLTLPRVLAIANQKGGVGKTATAVNLGAALADLGFRVLVVDLDPQGNATTGLGISHRNVEGTIYDVIMNDTPVEDCVEPTSVRNLFVVPATIDLAGAEIELVPAFSRELKLRRALQSAREEYDFLMIDCPPSLGLLTVNGLAAADDVLVPIQCE
jgi:chromosome partitioning protein